MLRPNALYDLLLQEVKNRKEQAININSVCVTINNLTYSMSQEDAKNHYRQIAALILHHELLENNGVLLCTIPYGGNPLFGDNGILYTIHNLPLTLQQIIAQYIVWYN